MATLLLVPAWSVAGTEGLRQGPLMARSGAGSTIGCV